jgi:hypothetical protein
VAWRKNTTDIVGIQSIQVGMTSPLQEPVDPDALVSAMVTLVNMPRHGHPMH